MNAQFPFPVFGGPTVAAVVYCQGDKSLAGDIASISEIVQIIVCVDDGSSASISAVLRALADRDVRLHIVRNTDNIVAARTEGFAMALDLGADVVVNIPVGQAIATNTLEMLVAPVVDGEYDVAKGSRFFDPAQTFLIRDQFDRAGLRLASGYWTITDADLRLFAIHGDVLRKIEMSDFTADMDFETQLLNQLGRIRARLTELPLDVAGDRFDAATPILMRHLKTAWSRLRANALNHGRSTALICVALSGIAFVASMFFLAATFAAGLPSFIAACALLGMSAHLLRRFIVHDIAAQPETPIHRYLAPTRPHTAEIFDGGRIIADIGRNQLEDMILLHTVEKTIH